MKSGFEIFDPVPVFRPPYHARVTHDAQNMTVYASGVDAIDALHVYPCECYCLTNGEPGVFVLTPITTLKLITPPRRTVTIRSDHRGPSLRIPCSVVLRHVGAKQGDEYMITEEAGGWCFRPRKK